MVYNNKISSKKNKTSLQILYSFMSYTRQACKIKFKKTKLTPQAISDYLNFSIQYSDHLLTPPAISNPFKGKLQSLWAD